MILYRAMSEEEYIETIKNNAPAFRNRFKFFSDNLDFIINRVRDGKFAHSKFKNNPYKYIIKFVFENIDNIRRLNKNEFMMDVRKIPLIKIITIEPIVH